MFQNFENESVSPSCQFAAVLQTRNSAKFEVIAAVLVNTQDLWDITSCLLIEPEVSAERSAYETSVIVRGCRVDWWLPTFRSHLKMSDRTT